MCHARFLIHVQYSIFYAAVPFDSLKKAFEELCIL